MYEEKCKDLDNLPLHLSWSKHCGGGWWEMSTRLLTLGDSVLLTRLSILISMRAGPISKLFALGLFSKGANDTYEATTGDRGALRNALGNELYLAVDLSLMGYGLFKKIPKINYLGNPMRDFFTKDPISYEYAFKQYSTLELIHLSVGASVTAYNNSDTYSGMIGIEDAWQRHLVRARINHDD